MAYILHYIAEEKGKRFWSWNTMANLLKELPTLIRQEFTEGIIIQDPIQLQKKQRIILHDLMKIIASVLMVNFVRFMRHR